jgi:hypothetical protein
MGNEQRYFYDYYMICCGPLSLPTRVAYHEGAERAFAADGSFDTSLARSGKISRSIFEKSKAS